MITALALDGNTPESTIARHFARCSYFALYTAGSKEIVYLKNVNRALKEKAGPATVKMLCDYKVEKVVSGEFGAGVQDRLNQFGIQMIIIPNPERTLQEVLDLLMANRK